jgi:hypothetical protein
VKNPSQNGLNGVEQRYALFKSPLLYQVELRACVRNFYHIQFTSASSNSSAGSGSGEPENGLSTGFHRGARSVRSTGGRRCPGRLVDFVPPAGRPSEVYYHNAYSLNQYLASQGYVVLAVNYRGGIGYGLEFREALEYGPRGASEFKDALGAGLYLQQRADVDPDRIGLWYEGISPRGADFGRWGALLAPHVTAST